MAAHIPRPAGVECEVTTADDGPDDATLVRRVLAGESSAFAALVRRHRRAALAGALAVVGDPADADDVAQDAFVHAYDRLATCRDPSRFGAWLLAIVRRRALNQLRTVRRRRAVPLDESLPADATHHAHRRLERDELRCPPL